MRLRALAMLASALLMAIAMTGPVGAQVLMTVSPESNDYGNVALGSTLGHSFHLSSTGMSELTIYLIAAVDTPFWGPMKLCGIEVPCEFAIATVTDSEGTLLQYGLPPGLVDFPMHVPPGKSMDFSVEFRPTTPGPHTDYIYILNNSPNQDVSLRLDGYGVGGTATVPEPNSLSLVATAMAGFAVYRWRCSRNTLQ